MKYNWNWGIFFEMSQDGSGMYWQTLLSGLQVTLTTAVCAWTLALMLGSVVGVCRTLQPPIAARLARAYVEVFRNIPLLVQLFLWYFVLPELVPAAAGTWLKQFPQASFMMAVIGIGFYMSARVAEQLRAGINALPRGQRFAGMALGMTTWQTYRVALLPMAYRLILPPLTSEFLNCIKNTSVALTIGLLELTSRAYAIQEESFQIFEAFAAATVIYLTVNGVVTYLLRRLEKRLAVPGYIGGH